MAWALLSVIASMRSVCHVTPPRRAGAHVTPSVGRSPHPERRARGPCLSPHLRRLWRTACVAVPFLGALATAAAAVTVPTNFVVENAVPGITFTVPTKVTFLPDGRY